MCGNDFLSGFRFLKCYYFTHLMRIFSSCAIRKFCVVLFLIQPVFPEKDLLYIAPHFISGHPFFPFNVSVLPSLNSVLIYLRLSPPGKGALSWPQAHLSLSLLFTILQMGAFTLNCKVLSWCHLLFSACQTPLAEGRSLYRGPSHVNGLISRFSVSQGLHKSLCFQLVELGNNFGLFSLWIN